MADDKLRDPLRRTRRWAKVWMGAAVVAGLGATLMVRNVIKRSRPRSEAVDTLEVVVAKSTMPMATTIAESQLRLVKVPKAMAPKGSFSKLDELVGRVVKETIIEGEPIVTGRLSSKESGSGLTAIIPEDMRAMAVKVNEVIGVAGFIHPNDRVDVIAVMAADPSSQNPQDKLPRAKVILQNIQVLATGQEMVDETKGQKAKPVTVVTLLVLPEDAERLALAAEEGSIRLAMRNPVDQFEVETTGITPPTLMTQGARPMSSAGAAGRRVARRDEPTPAPVEDPVAIVEVFHGKKLEERKIRPPGSPEESNKPTR